MLKKIISGVLLATTITVFSSITALAAGASALVLTLIVGKKQFLI